MDELTEQVSDWALRRDPTVDELTARAASLSLDQTAPTPSTFRPRVEFPEWNSETSCSSCPRIPVMNPPDLEDTGYFGERQCERCGIGDQGRNFWEEQASAIAAGKWTVWICELLDANEQEFTEPVWFWTQMDALEYAFWFTKNCGVAAYDISSSESPHRVADRFSTKGWDRRQTSVEAIAGWLKRNHRFALIDDLRREVKAFEITMDLCPIEEAESYTSNDSYPWSGVAAKLDPFYSTRMERTKREYCRRVIWWRGQGKSWSRFVRREGEDDLNFYCRSLLPHLPRAEAWEVSMGQVDQSTNLKELLQARGLDVRVGHFKFARKCRTKKPYPGAICFNEDWFIFVPQRESENPDEFHRRCASFKTKRAKRQKRVMQGSTEWTRTFKQEYGESLAAFLARVREEPGEEIINTRARPRGMILDWAS